MRPDISDRYKSLAMSNFNRLSVNGLVGMFKEYLHYSEVSTAFGSIVVGVCCMYGRGSVGLFHWSNLLVPGQIEGLQIAWSAGPVFLI